MKHTNSPQYEIDEILKCRADPIYFIEKYVMVQHPTKGMTLLDLHTKQEEILNAYHNDRNVIVGRGRQTGSSIITMSYMLWYAMFNNDQILVTAASAFKYAKDNLNKFRFAYDNLPDWLKSKRVVDNKNNMRFDNGTLIEATAITESCCRGYSISLLHIDDPLYASTTRQEGFWTSIFPVISGSNTSKVIVTSIPSNEGIFGNLWHNENDFTKMMLKFSDMHDDPQYLRTVIGEEQWKNEYECEFITSVQQHDLF